MNVPPDSNRLRAWAALNEPFFRIAEVVAVTVIGSYIGFQQAKIAEHSVNVSEKELIVAEKNLETAVFQMQIARSGLSPYFTFSGSLNSIVVKNTGGKARYLSGRTTYFIETDIALAAQPRQVELTNFMDTNDFNRASDKDVIEFHYPHYVNAPGDYRVLASAAFGRRQPMPNHKLFWYVELSFVDMSGNLKTERFVVDAITFASKPVDVEPAYEAEIDMRQYINEDKSPKHEELREALRNKVDEVLKHPPHLERIKTLFG